MSKCYRPLTKAEKRENHCKAMKKYYASNSDNYHDRYMANRTERKAYDKLYRTLNAEAIKLRDKMYNDTRRKKSTDKDK